MAQSTAKKKRFIAGATCPECKQLDTIVMYPDELKVECTRCDYEEIMTEEGPEKAPEKVLGADDTSVIKFVDPNEMG